jgi:hypothetical protein
MKVRFVGGALDGQTLECSGRLHELPLATRSGVRDFVSVPLAGRNVPRLAPEDALGSYEVYERIRLDKDLVELRYVGWQAYEAAKRETQERLGRWRRAIALIKSIPPRTVLFSPMIVLFFILYFFGLLFWVPVALVAKAFGRKMDLTPPAQEGSEWLFVGLALIVFLVLGLVAGVIAFILQLGAK